jgi:hypothetical protein
VPFQAEIRCECAFTCMNAVSRKNLTDVHTESANNVRTALDAGAAFGGVAGIAPSCRMIATCMWGVSDPLRAGRGAKKGAAKWGSLTPRWRSARLRHRRRLETGGTERRPAADGKPRTAKKIERSSFCSGQCDPCTPRTVRVFSRGTVLPSFGSPTLFPSELSSEAANREGETCR